MSQPPELSRRMFLRTGVAAGALLGGAVLAGCSSDSGGGSSSAGGGSSASASASGGGTPSASGGSSTSGGSASSGSAGSGSSASGSSAQSAASGQSADYQALIEGSKSEKSLTVYSNMTDENWKPIIDGFRAKYPWITKVATNDLGSAEVFQRYYNESSAGSSPAGLLVSGDPFSFKDLIGKGVAMDYQSPELASLPDFASPEPNLYTFSADPMLIAYNKTLVTGDQVPTGIESLISIATANKGTWAHKISTYDITSTFGLAIAWYWAKAQDPDWKLLNKLLPMTVSEGSSGTMVDKINSGEYLASFFISGPVVIPAVASSSGLLGWTYMDDGTPIFLRGMCIPKTAPQPNTSKLMLDYILSAEGQKAVFDGGFTPYRPGLDSSVTRTYQSIEGKVGKDNIVLINYDVPSEADVKSFQTRWQAAMKG